MHVVEELQTPETESINPYLHNEQYKLILTQFSNELKNILCKISNELSEFPKEEEQKYK